MHYEIKSRRRGGESRGGDRGRRARRAVTAVSTAAFAQALKMVRRKGTVSLVGLPPGEFPTPIFDVVLRRITVRGCIVGTRRDLAEAIAFAADGKVHAEVSTAPLEEINSVFDRMKAGKIDGRIVLDFG
jgi:propanol-preferring alcohol dehydrogenase